jgi:hypothetical protein
MSMQNQEDDAFGFAGLGSSARDRIKQIKPSTPAQEPADMARIDAMADNAGFVSREVIPDVQAAEDPLSLYQRSRLQRPEPRIPLNMRVPVTLGNAFQRFCQENRYSYPEALAEVMRRAGLPLK